MISKRAYHLKQPAEPVADTSGTEYPKILEDTAGNIEYTAEMHRNQCYYELATLTLQEFSP